MDVCRLLIVGLQMGRKRKQVEYDAARFDAMANYQKVELFESFHQLFHYELDRIPLEEITTSETGKAEDIAQRFYEEQGYEVYRSRVSDGYRVIGVEFYWKDHANKVSASDWQKIHRLRELLGPQGFQELALLSKDKAGTPDLLLIKDEKVSFVEVKFNYETVKLPTVLFWLKYGDRWPTSILRILQ